MALITNDGQILGKQICKALGVDSNYTQRIVLDIPPDGFVKAYVEMVAGDNVEMFVSDEILSVDWDLLKGAQIQILDKDGI